VERWNQRSVLRVAARKALSGALAQAVLPAPSVTVTPS
jgi:hypothetical protein